MIRTFQDWLDDIPDALSREVDMWPDTFQDMLDHWWDRWLEMEDEE